MEQEQLKFRKEMLEYEIKECEYCNPVMLCHFHNKEKKRIETK